MGSKSNNVWVQNYQDPFQKRVSAILDPLAAAKASGALKYDDVLSAQQKLEEEIAQLQRSQSAYETLGNTQRATIAGSRQTLDPIIKSWRDSVAGLLSELPPPDLTTADPNVATPPPTAASILAPLGQTPEKQAQKAATQQRKRAMSGEGRSSTILGGSGFKATTQKPTLLGY